MKKYYKDNTAKVYYDTELDTLFLEYLGKVQNDEQFIRINTAVLNAFTQLSTIKFVADIRKMGIISINSQLLDPSEVFSKVSASNIKNKSKQVADGFDVMQFTDVNEMKTYLKEMK